MKHARLLIIAVLSSRAGLHAQVDTGRPTSGTPYDGYLSPMRQTYAGMRGGSPTTDDVRAQLRIAHRFRYFFDPAQPYTPQLPSVTESRGEGDCKAKSLWLANKLGDRRIRYVIGKVSPSSKIAHAWLLWPNGGSWTFLDPTNSSELILADRVVGRRLFSRYSYAGSSAYLHPTYGQYIKE